MCNNIVQMLESYGMTLGISPFGVYLDNNKTVPISGAPDYWSTYFRSLASESRKQEHHQHQVIQDCSWKVHSLVGQQWPQMNSNKMLAMWKTLWHSTTFSTPFWKQLHCVLITILGTHCPCHKHLFPFQTCHQFMNRLLIIVKHTVRIAMWMEHGWVACLYVQEQ